MKFYAAYTHTHRHNNNNDDGYGFNRLILRLNTISASLRFLSLVSIGTL